MGGQFWLFARRKSHTISSQTSISADAYRNEILGFRLNRSLVSLFSSAVICGRPLPPQRAWLLWSQYSRHQFEIVSRKTALFQTLSWTFFEWLSGRFFPRPKERIEVFLRSKGIKFYFWPFTYFSHCKQDFSLSRYSLLLD